MKWTRPYAGILWSPQRFPLADTLAGVFMRAQCGLRVHRSKGWSGAAWRALILEIRRRTRYDRTIMEDLGEDLGKSDLRKLEGKRQVQRAKQCAGLP
jgi:hypothetical protein